MQLSAVAARKAARQQAQQEQQANNNNNNKAQDITNEKETNEDSASENDSIEIDKSEEATVTKAQTRESTRKRKAATTTTTTTKNSRKRYFMTPEPSTPSAPVSTQQSENSEGEQETPPSRSQRPSKPLGPIDQSCYSSFIPKLLENMIENSDGSVELVLELNQNVIIQGLFNLKVLQGSVNIMGSNLKATENVHPFYCPSTHPLPRIEVSDQGTRILVSPLTNTGFQGIELFAKRGMMIPRRYNMFFYTQDDLSEECISNIVKSTFTLIISPMPDLTVVKCPHHWNEFLDSLPTPESRYNNENKNNAIDSRGRSNRDDHDHDEGRIVTMIEGSKGSGKSTLSRMALNRLIGLHGRVAWLETDVGQPEFGPIGIVGLHILDQPCFGISMAYQNSALASHFIGSTSPKTNPDGYLRCISSLMKYYETNLQVSGIPMVVNVQGWTKGLGESIMSSIRSITKPTHHIELPSPVPIQVLQQQQQQQVAFSTPTLEPEAPTWSPRLTHAELRMFNILSYFYRYGNNKQTSHQYNSCWDFGKPLTHVLPTVVNWSSLSDGIYWSGLGDRVGSKWKKNADSRRSIETEVMAALNGSLVGLISKRNSSSMDGEEDEGDEEQEDDQNLEEVNGTDSQSFTRLNLTDSSVISSRQCLGLAIVRSIDVVNKKLHLLVPASCLITQYKNMENVKQTEALQMLQNNCTGLALGDDLELPVLAMLGYEDDDLSGNLWDETPYLTFQRLQGQGGAKRRARKNLMRRAQMIRRV